MDLETIKKASKMLSSGSTIKEIEEQTGIKRNYVSNLVKVYDLMQDRTVVADKNSDYVRVKKKRYMMQKIKLQHKIADIRKEYHKQLEILKRKRRKLYEYADKKEEFDDLLKELHNKQLMLNVTSKNLQHAEDGYEMLKRDHVVNKILAFVYGMGFVFFCMFLFKLAGGEVRLIY
ncbi:MAG: hypothetical protein RBR70_12800 [Arcobacter sp.]|jgi:hypothetical protein|uniref:hypothetical protein n=1 Tax=Arcobacter sp. TaxID=1872629 RepID=UPI002A74E0E1|nr:hypothetical protein [Arcobacter sp.]MDY3205942.1 hypothetical protein [Arcobacter sp.]